MERWPPIVWPAMSLASLLILMGLGPWDPVALVLGVVLALAVFGIAVWLAFGRHRDRPLPRGFGALMAALTLFYAVNAAMAAFVDTRYVVGALLASLIPLSALLLLIATARSKPPGAENDERDPVPGLSARP
jgi:NO-binding membrane sensor protein with MHYT domain